jgi:SOS response regulatory protein OraA/RecX
MAASKWTDRRARQHELRERRSAITDPDIVMAAAAGLLAIRSRTTHELRVRLVALGYPVVLIDQTLDRLLALGYLDDEGYARAWMAGRDRSRPRGASTLRRELLRKGLAPALIDTALQERDLAASPAVDGAVPASWHQPQDGSADLAAALRLLDRKRTALRRETDIRKLRQRAYALLARHGFDPDVCRQALSGLTADDEAETEEGSGPDLDGPE